MSESQQGLMKLMVLHSRKEGVSYEEFVRLGTEMMKGAAHILERHGVVHFSLTFSNSAHQQAMKDLIQATGRGDGWTVSNFDSISTYVLPSLDIMAAVQADPEWQQHVTEYQKPFADLETTHLVIGDDIVIF